MEINSMKYFSELSKIESAIIKLETIKSLTSVIAMGSDSSNAEDLRNSLYCLEGLIESTHNELREAFDNTWETVREDTHEVKPKKEKK